MYTRSLSMVPRTISGLLDDIFQGGSLYGRGMDLRSGMRPVTNIRETDKAFVVQLVVPGMQKEDFKVNVDQRLLTISGEHKEDVQQETGKWIRREFEQSAFRKSFMLNEQVDAAGITAAYNNGILEVTLPKKECAHPAVQVVEVK